MNKSLSNGKYISYNPAFKDIGELREKEGKQGGYARQTVHLVYIKLHSCSIDVLIEADYCQISSSTMCLMRVCQNENTIMIILQLEIIH